MQNLNETSSEVLQVSQRSLCFSEISNHSKKEGENTTDEVFPLPGIANVEKHHSTATFGVGNDLAQTDLTEDLSNESDKPIKQMELTAAEKARCERNRQKALLLRQSRLSKQQLQGNLQNASGYSRLIDTGGGFLLEETGDVNPRKLKKVEELPPVIPGEETICLECDQPFQDSYLQTTYDYPVCDKCRDSDDKHSVITKTQAKDLYLLSETDLNVREPPLKCVIRKNPRNNRWGDMKLYLKIQAEERALEVWGSPEALEEERSNRQVKKEEAKRKKFNKKMNKLRQEVRSSLYEVKTAGHVHIFGAEVPCEEEEDMWVKKCTLCGHQMTFEKM